MYSVSNVVTEGKENRKENVLCHKNQIGSTQVS